MYKSSTIASYFISKSLETGDHVTPMKLVKLVYIAHGWYLALYDGKPLINEAIQAWKYGPVVSKVYHDYKHFGSSPIQQQVFKMTEDISENDKMFLDKIWDVYKKFSGLQLSTITHEEGTPWNKTYVEGQKNIQIPNELIEQHYKEKANN